MLHLVLHLLLGRYLIFCAVRASYQSWFRQSFMLTCNRYFDSVRRFAPKRRSLHYQQTQSALRIKFEDSRTKSPDLDPKGSRLGESPSRIFDKLVERASREMRSSLAWSSHKVRCPVSFVRKLRGHGRPNRPPSGWEDIRLQTRV